MRNWRNWAIVVLLFWPLVTVFILGSRWSGRVVEQLSPPSAVESPVSPQIPTTRTQVQPSTTSSLPAPSAPVSQPHQDLASDPDLDRELADEFWQEYLNQPEP